MKKKKTQRGFAIVEFSDRYDHACSLQKSSIIGDKEHGNCIWFGPDDAQPQILIPGEGWVPVECPPETSFYTRMHLSQRQVKGLLPFLKKFAKTGEL